MIKIRSFLIAIISVCALQLGAQTLTATYVEYADSADRYIRQERWDDAERMIVKALRYEPANKSNYLLWSNLGIVRTNKGDISGALEAYDIGLASAPNSTTMLSNRARTYLAAGKSDEALSDINRSLALDSCLQWPLKMRGVLSMHTGKIDEAKHDFIRYSNLFGKDATVEESLGDIAVIESNHKKAAKHYEEACKLEPKEEELELKRLWALYNTEDNDALAAALVKAIKAFPRCGMIYVIRGLSNKRNFQNSAMESDRKIALSLGVDKQVVNQLLPLQ